MENNNSRIIIITGPTATGKTDISVDFATRFNGEIVISPSSSNARMCELRLPFRTVIEDED